MQNDIEAIKVYQYLSKLSRRFACFESSKPSESNLKNISDMTNSEATKQAMLPDTSTCVADHNDELWKDSVIDYVRKTDEESVLISCDRARADPVRKCKHAPWDREPSRIPYKKTSSLFRKEKIIRKCMVHYLKKNVPKCLFLAFGNKIILQ